MREALPGARPAHARACAKVKCGAPLLAQPCAPASPCSRACSSSSPSLPALALRGDAPAPGVPVVPTPPGEQDGGAADPRPVRLRPRRRGRARRAAPRPGTSHVLYARSPGGAAATAERVARWRPQVEARGARRPASSPDLLEALVFLESAGREDAMAGDTEGAVGLTQILAETGQNLLGMQRRRRAQRAADAPDRPRAAARAASPRSQALRRERRAVDERYDPAKALAGTARYLTIARERARPRGPRVRLLPHGRSATCRTCCAPTARTSRPTRGVYFDSTPDHHADVQRRLAAFGDDSSNYLWKLYAAREIMRLYRDDPARARAPARRCRRRRTRPRRCCTRPTRRRASPTPDALRAAWDDGAIRAFPNDPALHRAGARPRAWASSRGGVGAAAGLYRGLRPEALAMALYIGAQVREYAGGDGAAASSPRPCATRPTSACSCAATARRRATTRCTRPAGRSTSRAPTARGRQALAFQFVLDRLQVLERDRLGARARRDPRHRRRRDAEALLPLLERLDARPPRPAGSVGRGLARSRLGGRGARRGARLVGRARAAVGVAAARGRA